ncbi:ribonuclease H-like domain-containing protein [Tanacetum coccineum]
MYQTSLSARDVASSWMMQSTPPVALSGKQRILYRALCRFPVHRRPYHEGICFAMMSLGDLMKYKDEDLLVVTSETIIPFTNVVTDTREDLQPRQRSPRVARHPVENVNVQLMHTLVRSVVVSLVLVQEVVVKEGEEEEEEANGLLIRKKRKIDVGGSSTSSVGENPYPDDREARSMELHEELRSLEFRSLTTVEYFKKIKVISDLLSNIDSLVSEKNLLMIGPTKSCAVFFSVAFVGSVIGASSFTLVALLMADPHSGVHRPRSHATWVGQQAGALQHYARGSHVVSRPILMLYGLVSHPSLRPDLSYAVQQLCLYMHDPRVPHFHAMKCVLCYLWGITDLGLQLSGPLHHSLLLILTLTRQVA